MMHITIQLCKHFKLRCTLTVFLVCGTLKDIETPSCGDSTCKLCCELEDKDMKPSSPTEHCPYLLGELPA